MVSSRRTRILVLTAITFAVGLLIFAYPGGQHDPSKLFGTMEEKARLGVEGKGSKEEVAPAVVGPAKDLTNDPGQPFSPEKEYSAILSEAPVVIFSKSFCPHSKFVKDLLLSEYQITPVPLVVELDKHPHGRELQDFIALTTGRKTVPNVHVKGTTRGGGDEFRSLHNSGELTETMQKWGGTSFLIKRLAPPSSS